MLYSCFKGTRWPLTESWLSPTDFAGWGGRPNLGAVVRLRLQLLHGDQGLQEAALQVAALGQQVKASLRVGQEQRQGHGEARHVNGEGPVGLPRRVKAGHFALFHQGPLETEASHQADGPDRDPLGGTDLPGREAEEKISATIFASFLNPGLTMKPQFFLTVGLLLFLGSAMALKTLLKLLGLQPFI